MYFSKELDIFGLLFLGLDEESFECFCEVVINCLLISFCIYVVFMVGLIFVDNVRGYFIV